MVVWVWCSVGVSTDVSIVVSVVVTIILTSKDTMLHYILVIEYIQEIFPLIYSNKLESNSERLFNEVKNEHLVMRLFAEQDDTLRYTLYYQFFTLININSQVLWSDDCSNASNWVFTNSSTPPKDWSIETESLSNLMSSFPPNAQTAWFSTAANGFLFIGFDSDDEDSNGTPTVAEATNASPINLNGFQNVMLNFQHNCTTNCRQSLTNHH